MKVDSTTLYSVDPGQASGVKAAQSGASSFSDVLAKAVASDDNNTNATSGALAVSSLTPLSGLGPSPLWNQVDNLLTSLDNYAAALGDSSKTLKDLEPLASQMEQNADQVDQQLGGAGLSGQGQDDLTNLAVQAVTQARVEAFKYRRGDYL